MDIISDKDVWEFINPEDLWIYDKLILSKKLNYNCGPAGVDPKTPGEYIIRPCVNFRMMGHGASIMHLVPGNSENIPHGYFWCEMFTGRHLSFDYHHGVQCLAVEGFKDDPYNLSRFSRWTKVEETFMLPSFLQEIAVKYEWLNIEVIGNHIIEVHLRYNDDFRNHDGDTIIPIWKEDFYPSVCDDRIGFIVQRSRRINGDSADCKSAASGTLGSIPRCSTNLTKGV